MKNSSPLSGFAHGTAGIAYGLFRLAKATKQKKYLETAYEALKYDRSTYSPKHRNWLDLRDWVPSPDSVVWCYGAPGVGLSRLAQIRMGYEDEYCNEELEIAFEKAVSSEWRAHNLCHGGFGNLECLSLMSERALHDGSTSRVKSYMRLLLEDLAEGGVLFDGHSETLNLMLGIAGIGEVLLRRAYPSQIPSVLLLESPLPQR